MPRSLPTLPSQNRSCPIWWLWNPMEATPPWLGISTFKAQSKAISTPFEANQYWSSRRSLWRKCVRLAHDFCIFFSEPYISSQPSTLKEHTADLWRDAQPARIGLGHHPSKSDKIGYYCWSSGCIARENRSVGRLDVNKASKEKCTGGETTTMAGLSKVLVAIFGWQDVWHGLVACGSGGIAFAAAAVWQGQLHIWQNLVSMSLRIPETWEKTLLYDIDCEGPIGRLLRHSYTKGAPVWKEVEVIINETGKEFGVNTTSKMPSLRLFFKSKWSFLSLSFISCLRASVAVLCGAGVAWLLGIVFYNMWLWSISLIQVFSVTLHWCVGSQPFCINSLRSSLSSPDTITLTTIQVSQTKEMLFRQPNLISHI